MTSAGTYLKAYKNASHTVGKTRQLVMLYDGIIRLLQQAGDCMEKKDIEGRYNKLARAGEVLIGLQSCLDFDAGGKTAQVLYDFYSSIDARLLNLHRSNDKAACLKLVDELKQMRDTWDRIDRNETDGKPANSQKASALPDAVTFSA